MGRIRQYCEGSKITSLDQMAKQKFVYVHGKIYCIGWAMSWQVSMAKMYIDKGEMFEAIERKCDNCTHKRKIVYPDGHSEYLCVKYPNVKKIDGLEYLCKNHKVMEEMINER